VDGAALAFTAPLAIVTVTVMHIDPEAWLCLGVTPDGTLGFILSY
jgi:hypothetical protein